MPGRRGTRGQRREALFIIFARISIPASGVGSPSSGLMAEWLNQFSYDDSEIKTLEAAGRARFLRRPCAHLARAGDLRSQWRRRSNATVVFQPAYNKGRPAFPGGRFLCSLGLQLVRHAEKCLR